MARRSQRVANRNNPNSGGNPVNTSSDVNQEVDPAILAAVNQAVSSMLPAIVAQAVGAAQQNNTGGLNAIPEPQVGGNPNQTGGTSGVTPNEAIHVWLERFQKQKPQSFSSASTPVDAENWIAHIQKIFEVLGCPEVHKVKLATYKLEGDAHRWWFAIKQAKGNAYVDALSWMGFREAFYQQYFSAADRNAFVREFAGFVRALAGTAAEQAEKFRWTILGKYRSQMINDVLTDVAEAANKAKNIEMDHQDLASQSDGSKKRNRDEQQIHQVSQQNQHQGGNRGNQWGQSGNKRQVQWQGHNQGQRQSHRQQGQGQNQNRFPRPGDRGGHDSVPRCNSCGRRHPGNVCYRASGACFLCGQSGHLAKDCKDPRNTDKGNGTKTTTGGRVFALTATQAANSGLISGTLSIGAYDVYVLFDTGATHSVVSTIFASHLKVPYTLLESPLSIATPLDNSVIVSHSYKGCPIKIGDQIRETDLLPIRMTDLILFWGSIGYLSIKRQLFAKLSKWSSVT